MLEIFSNLLTEAMETIGTLDKHGWEKKENPQSYSLMPSYAEHPRPSQHILGIVGGNEVPYKNRLLQVDTESDLRGITRANTFCPKHQHAPAHADPSVATIERNTPKEKVTIALHKEPLKNSQMWAYPATLAPEAMTIETCLRPEKY
ncbi:MAG: hypothetical protein EBV30_09845 [Actinobacteria bacterium]|nr:hypothetical protein [Actinomycetota bacterium]